MHNGFLLPHCPRCFQTTVSVLTRECEILGRPLESKVCVYSFLLPLNISLTGFQSLTIWGLLLLWYRTPGLESQVWGWTPAPPGDPLWVSRPSPTNLLLVSPDLEMWAWLDWVSTFLPVSWWLLYIFSCEYNFWWSSRLFSETVACK